jgi:uncharacterized membrane protein YkoI
MRRLRRLIFGAVLAVVVPSLPLASADDQERARQALAAGRILPLAMIVERAIARFGGRVLDVTYEADDDDGDERQRRSPRRYEVKLLTSDGRILNLDYDAVTGELIGQRGRQRGRHHEGHGDDGDD